MCLSVNSLLASIPSCFIIITFASEQAPEGKHAHRGPIDKSMKHLDAKRRRIALTTVPSLNIQTPPSTYYMSSETNTAMSHNGMSSVLFQ